jgi:hypothetical protein
MSKMMKVRMKVSIASATFSYQPDQVALVEADLAQKWIAVGHAEKVDKDTPVTDPVSLTTNDFMVHDPTVVRRMQGMVV